MQTKLTLRVEESVVRKAKRVARQRGTSVSQMVSDYIAAQPDDELEEELPPITASMLGVLKSDGAQAEESAYKKHLEEKYL